MAPGKALTIGLLAGEASGDNLGAGLMAELTRQAQDQGYDSIRFIGVGGERMLALGLEPLASIESLQVNGFREPLMRLPSLLKLLFKLTRDILAAEVDAFIGVDFNVFNFLLEGRLKRRGIKTAHYVSPSVYAWRSGRTRRVAKSADLLLCLYPFEPDFYVDTSVEAVYVGHPLADEIDLEAGSAAARLRACDELGIHSGQTVLAVLPGSRGSEVALMIERFLGAASLFSSAREEAGETVTVVIPCLRAQLRERIESALAEYPALNVVLYDGNARRALTAADIALVKSGTSTLEGMLLHRPMVVSYALGNLSYQLARHLVRAPYVALPNILAGRALIPELLQHDATAESLAAALEETHRADGNISAYRELHDTLRQGADENAARAVLRLCSQPAP